MQTARLRPWLTTTVLAIGIASLLSDACYELIIPLLPAFITALGGGAFALGLIEGTADLTASAAKLWGGRLADYTPRRRAWTAAGYVGVGVFMPAIAFAASIPAVLMLRGAAWICRGFRSPIRDTLLVDGTDARFVNRAFGFQRALDTVGAVIGPAVAIGLIAAGVPVVKAIMTGFIPGLVAGSLYFWVQERPRTAPAPQPLYLGLRALPADFKRYLLGAGIFGLGNFSATLLVLVAIRAFSPLVGTTHAVALATALYLLHNVLFAVFAYPLSVMSERFGSGRLLLAAFALFAVASALLALAAGSVAAVIAAVVLSAIAIAIVEPMEGTFATQLLPQATRGTGFGALAAINGIGDFASSAGVGGLWQAFGPLPAFGASALLCLIGIAVLRPLAARPESSASFQR